MAATPISDFNGTLQSSFCSCLLVLLRIFLEEQPLNSKCSNVGVEVYANVLRFFVVFSEWLLQHICGGFRCATGNKMIWDALE